MLENGKQEAKDTKTTNEQKSSFAKITLGGERWDEEPLKKQQAAKAVESI